MQILLSAAFLFCGYVPGPKALQVPCVLDFSLVTQGPWQLTALPCVWFKVKDQMPLQVLVFATFWGTFLAPYCFLSVLLYLKSELYHKILDFFSEYRNTYSIQISHTL